MLEGKPTILLSYSTRFADAVAKPVAEGLGPFGFRVVLVGEEPLPPGVDSNPNAKVEWFFEQSEMAVFLATPDDRLAQSDEVYTRPNIIDEHRLGLQSPHLRHKLLVFKASEVSLPSNINPAYEQLPLDDPAWIVERIVEQARTWGVYPHREDVARDRSPQSPDQGAPLPVTAIDADSAAAMQAASSLQGAIEALSGADTDTASLLRAELAIAGVAAGRGSTDTLGVHLANAVFVCRHEFRVLEAERRLLLRTYLAHRREDNVPGMFWLAELPRREVLDLLNAFARQDSDAAVRSQSLALLAKLGQPRSIDDARTLLEPFIASRDSQMHWAAIDYVLERREARLRDLLDDPRLLEHERYRASLAAAQLDLPRHPGKVMQRYIEDAYIRDNTVEQALLASAARIGAAVIDTAIGSTVAKVQMLGLRLAGEKRALPTPRALEVIQTSTSPGVRLQAVRALLLSGGSVDLDLLNSAARKRDGDASAELSSFDEERALEVEVGLRLPVSALLQNVQWTTVGPSMYEALGRRDQQWVGRHVRRDLGNDFRRIQRAWREKLTTQIMADARERAGGRLSAEMREVLRRACEERLSEWFDEEKLGGFLLRLFRRAALRLLVQHGGASDVRFARRFATDDDQDIRVEALRLFERFGTSHDAATVLGLADRVYDDAHRQRAAETALRLARQNGKLSVLAELREKPAVRVWAVRRLGDLPGGFQVAVGLLRSDDAEVRLAAASVAWAAIPPERRDELLSLYMSGRHFYNVVRAIDRQLYAPSWLQEALTEP